MPTRTIRERGGHPLTLRGILGVLALRMKEYGGVEHLAHLAGGRYRTLHQWARNQRRISTQASANHLELLCKLWDAQIIIYDRTRPGGRAIPPDHLVVSAPDGWWLLAKGQPWQERCPWPPGGVSHLLPFAAPAPAGYDVPPLPHTLPGCISALCAKTRPSSTELFWFLSGLESGLSPISHWAPPVLWSAIREARKMLAPDKPRGTPELALATLRSAVGVFYQGVPTSTPSLKSHRPAK